MAMWTPLEFSSCGDEWLCQHCVKRGLPTCWVHCDANRTASTSRRAVICDKSFPVLCLPSQLQNLTEQTAAIIALRSIVVTHLLYIYIIYNIYETQQQQDKVLFVSPQWTAQLDQCNTGSVLSSPVQGQQGSQGWLLGQTLSCWYHPTLPCGSHPNGERMINLNYC